MPIRFVDFLNALTKCGLDDDCAPAVRSLIINFVPRDGQRVREDNWVRSDGGRVFIWYDRDGLVTGIELYEKP